MVILSPNEIIRGSSEDQIQVLNRLSRSRSNYSHFLESTHPSLTFLTISQLLDDPNPLIDISIFNKGIQELEQRQGVLNISETLPLDRVFIGVRSDSSGVFFGGFHHPDQGYRFIQKIAISSLAGYLGNFNLPRELVTLELLRAYIHDNLHYLSFRSFRRDKENMLGFFRLQYGMNFRKQNGETYSEKDPVKLQTTRNIGVIMEAAVDKFAQELVLKVSNEIKYNPQSSESLIEEMVYKGCTGNLLLSDLVKLRKVEKDQALSSDARTSEYLKSLRLFTQYVNFRYHNFLNEFFSIPQEAEEVQNLILQAIISGKMKRLVGKLNRDAYQHGGFKGLFKSSSY